MGELNPEQRKAVEHGEGPLLVIAGPGSGKTRVITERIVHLLRVVPGLQPRNVLALTYTDKAAAEMLARVRQALPDLQQAPRIFTFHAFCFHLLSQRHFERVLLDEVDVWIFLRRRMQQLGLEHYRKLAEPGAFLHHLNQFFSRCQDELVEPGDFEAYVDQAELAFAKCAAQLDAAERAEAQLEIDKRKELARVFRHSRRLIEQASRSSFGSLISETLQLWEREPEALERCHEVYRYLLVDEFQDTNFAQLRLLERLAAPPCNVTAVGDDDQAIYRFRGASHGQFRMFDQAFPGHQTVYLNQNYRSTKKILRTAGVVIEKNERYENRRALKTDAPEGEKVCLVDSPDYASEAGWVAGEIERLVKRGRAFGEVAVLYRAHGYRDPLVQEFRRRRIPFAIRGLSILASPMIRDLAAWLTLIHSPHDNISLTRVLLAPYWRFPEDLALRLRKQASRERCSIYMAIEAEERTPRQPDLELTGWPELKNMMCELQAVSRHAPVTVLFEHLVKRLRLTFLPGNPERNLVEGFRKFLHAWEGKSETRKLPEFMEYFQYFVEAGGTIEAPEPAGPASAVQMMTVHAAKGLEFPVVFLISVAARRFPHSEQRAVIEFPDDLRKGPLPPRNIHLQEERRLFYVALTRARERLYVTSVNPQVGRGRRTSELVRDLLSNEVVAARDIECIRVRAVGAAPAPSLGQAADHAQGIEAPAAGAPRPLPRQPLEAASQYTLFGSAEEAAPGSAYGHPDLKTWARRTPANGLLGPDGKLHLSATAIETYRECPLKFKFAYSYRIPTGPQAALTFGAVMHQSVRQYFELRKKGLPRFAEVQDYYLSSWKDMGFEDSYQEQTYKQAGLEQLREFVERQNAVALNDESVTSELRFSLDLGDMVLQGRIDQVNYLHEKVRRPPAAGRGEDSRLEFPRGGKIAGNAAGTAADAQKAALPVVELIDYKTGRPRSQKDADKSLQLSVYALAARRELQIHAARLTFYNLTNNQPVSTVRLLKDLDKALEIVREVAGRIRNLEFDAKPGFACRYCEYVPVCPAHEEGV